MYIISLSRVGLGGITICSLHVWYNVIIACIASPIDRQKILYRPVNTGRCVSDYRSWWSGMCIAPSVIMINHDIIARLCIFGRSIWYCHNIKIHDRYQTRIFLKSSLIQDDKFRCIGGNVRHFPWKNRIENLFKKIKNDTIPQLLINHRGHPRFFFSYIQLL